MCEGGGSLPGVCNVPPSVGWEAQQGGGPRPFTGTDDLLKEGHSSESEKFLV